MGKIYVVTAGEYSAYHIVAATTMKRHAENVKKLYNDNAGWDGAKIEEYEDSKEYPVPLWEVNFDRMGNAYWAESQYSTMQEKTIVKKDHDFPGAYHVGVYVRAKDRKTAIKAAAERRAKALAEREDL